VTLTDDPQRSRRRIYRIADNFSLSTTPWTTCRYALCGREEIINADPDTLTITAEDIISPGE
jgi:hypothetical protein